MKQSIISAVIGFSKWLHGESGKHFRTYTYPRIKRFTRRFVNLGLYEFIERFYKIVDDTFYQGAVEPDQTEVDMGEFERLADSYDEADRGQIVLALPNFEDIFDSLYIWKGIEQAKTYRCGTFSVNNMLRTAMLKKGLQPPLEVTAIDPLYIMTKHGKGKSGTVMNNLFDWLKANSFPIPAWQPRMTNHDKELEALEENGNLKNAMKFASVKTADMRYTRSFEEAVQYDKNLPANYEMQVSISFNKSIKYWGQKVPFVRKVGGKYDFKRTGGHSVHGVRGSFSRWEDGERGMAIIESAYRSSEDGFRFLKKRLFDFGLITVRFVRIDIDQNIVNPTPEPTPVEPPKPVHKYQVLADVDIQINENNKNVTLLQKYLLEEGFAIPAGATGFFGEQTRLALKAWQDEQFGDKYFGTKWGQISRDRFKQLENIQ